MPPMRIALVLVLLVAAPTSLAVGVTRTADPCIDKDAEDPTGIVVIDGDCTKRPIIVAVTVVAEDGEIFVHVVVTYADYTIEIVRACLETRVGDHIVRDSRCGYDPRWLA